ncbi:MAG: hypothetical protein Q7N50_15105 [Armatimonadota bacterium]|nr:hypothetical protein [Armatimonadota bacterium]
MTQPFSPRFKAPAILAALVAMLALAAVTAGAESCPSMEGTMSETSETSASPSMPAMPHMTSAPIMAPSGLASASSTSENAWIVLGGPASNNVQRVHGVIGFKVRDASSRKAADSGDTVDYALARIHSPVDNGVYEIKFTGTDRTSPHSFLGGVALLEPVFGDTGIGESALPKALAYIAAWGTANVYKNGQLIGNAIPAHLMATQSIRDPSTGRLLASADMDNREIMLHVPGPVSGLSDGMLLVSWSNVALDLRDIGGSVMTEKQVAEAPVTGITAGMVAGEVVEIPQEQIVNVSIRNDGFRITKPTLFAGFTTFRITNNSSSVKGALVRGRDLAGSMFERYTQLLRPGDSQLIQVYLPSGSFTLAEFHQVMRGGEIFWRSAYRTSIKVQ